ncbi:MAG: Stp1/IreP family PP2C-type Ser/Thr phosphatase [Burkholderiaceae bacterium]|jgi:protein phosphatase|nr:Stp1/IreP family PP2C-type Ser/Thr phosphatase [Burkholderiaceae bacterium]
MTRARRRPKPSRPPIRPAAVWCALTDVGHVRDNNEDAVLVDPARGLAVLADGMGGYNAGEVASAMAVELVGGQLGQWLDRAGAAARPEEIASAMHTCVEQANRAIFQAACTNPGYAGMGTTLVAAALHGQTLLIGHIGDSRAYRLRGGVLRQLTGDHSLLQEQLDMGLITEEEAEFSPHRGLLTRALGVDGDAVSLDVQAQTVEPGDLYLLCSDGLTDMLTSSDIAAVLTGTAPLADQAQALLDKANAQGGYDNISLILCLMPGAIP